MGEGNILSRQAENNERKKIMKCDIIEDLLPSYIEGLTSRSSNKEIEEHLQHCEGCKNFYQEMSGSTEKVKAAVNPTEIKNLDYLKKVRRKQIKRVILSVCIMLVLFIAAIGLFLVNTQVSLKDIKLSYQKIGSSFQVNLKLEDGYDLIFSGETRALYNKENQVIGSEQRYKPMKILHNPFDDVGAEVTLGTELSGKIGDQNTLILEFKDQTLTFVNGELLE